MSSARTKARNLLAEWGAHGANMVVLFFLSPFVVHTLGKTEYGVWSLLNVLTGYMGILDLGVRASTGRHVILYLGKGDRAAADETIRTGLGFFSAVGVVIVAVGVALGWAFPSFFASVPAEYQLVVKLLVPLMAVNVWLSAFGAVFSSVLTAHDRFDIARGVDIVVLGIRAGGTILVLNAGHGLMGLVAVTLACGAVALLGNLICARRVYPPLRIWPPAFDRARLRELLGYGLAAFVGTIGVKVIGQTDLVIVGAAIDVEAVTVYSVGAMLVYYSSSFLSQIESVFFPPVQRAVARGEIGDVRWLFFRQVRLGMILGLPICVGFMVFAEPFIQLWMGGPEFDQSAVRLAALVMVVLSASKIPLLFTMGSSGLLAATGNVKFNAVLTIVEAAVNLGLSLLFVLVLGWGLVGVAAGTLAARLLVRTFLHPWYACRRIRTSWSAYLVRIGGALLLAGAAFAGLCRLVRAVVPEGTWVMFSVQVCLSLLLYLPLALVVLVPPDDRKRILGKMGLGGIA